MASNSHFFKGWENAAWNVNMYAVYGTLNLLLSSWSLSNGGCWRRWIVFVHVGTRGHLSEHNKCEVTDEELWAQWKKGLSSTQTICFPNETVRCLLSLAGTILPFPSYEMATGLSGFSQWVRRLVTGELRLILNNSLWLLVLELQIGGCLE
jgi:hypothetical protein